MQACSRPFIGDHALNYKGAPFFIKTRCAHLRNKRETNRKMNPQTPPEEEFTIKILSILKSNKSCSRPQHHKKNLQGFQNLGGLKKI